METKKYVPVEERDSTWYLFERPFYCRVPYIATMTPDYMRMMGTPTTGDRLRDQVQNKQRVTTWLTVAKMIDYFEQGIEVGIINIADTKSIYDIVAEHLRQWKHKLDNGFNNAVHADVIKDLILIDRFASSVYKHAHVFFPKEEQVNYFNKAGGTNMRVTRDMFSSPALRAPVPDPQSISEHGSMAEAFRAHQQAVVARRPSRR